MPAAVFAELTGTWRGRAPVFELFEAYCTGLLEKMLEAKPANKRTPSRPLHAPDALTPSTTAPGSRVPAPIAPAGPAVPQRVLHKFYIRCLVMELAAASGLPTAAHHLLLAAPANSIRGGRYSANICFMIAGLQFVMAMPAVLSLLLQPTLVAWMRDRLPAARDAMRLAHDRTLAGLEVDEQDRLRARLGVVCSPGASMIDCLAGAQCVIVCVRVLLTHRVCAGLLMGALMLAQHSWLCVP